MESYQDDNGRTATERMKEGSMVYKVTFMVVASSEDDVVKWAAKRGEEIASGRWGVEFKRYDIEEVNTPIMKAAAAASKEVEEEYRRKDAGEV